MTSEDTQAAANMGIKLPEPYCRTGDSMAPTLQPLFSAEQMQAMFEVGRSRAASEPGEVAPAPDLSSDTVVELQMLEEHLERWARGECLSAPKNGYDDPGHRTASMRDVTKTLAFLLPRFKNARAALLKFAVEYEQFKSGTYSPEDEGAGWPFPSSSAPQPAPSPVAAEGQKAVRDWSVVEAAIDSYIEDYEMLGEAEDGRDASYTPNDSDRALMKDFAMGLLSDDAFMAALATPTASMAPKAESEAEWAHLKKFGYAPGGYMNKCHACGKVVEFVDKRATTCRPCAEAMHDAAPVAQAAAVASERERLRAAQDAAVMPLIGPLLDAWECSSHRLRDEFPELAKQLRAIDRAMEEADADRASGGGV